MESSTIETYSLRQILDMDPGWIPIFIQKFGLPVTGDPLADIAKKLDQLGKLTLEPPFKPLSYVMPFIRSTAPGMEMVGTKEVITTMGFTPATSRLDIMLQLYVINQLAVAARQAGIRIQGLPDSLMNTKITSIFKEPEFEGRPVPDFLRK